MRRVRARAWLSAVMLCALALVALAPAPPVARGVELPPVGSPIFIQTNGPQARIDLGDWYTSDQNGINGAYHYFSITVPCRWPASLPLHIDLFSPEINTFGPVPRIDEVESMPLDETVFELYAPGTALDLPKSPGPGDPGSLIQRTFAPVTNRAEAWERFFTIAAPVTCGTYLLRVETKGDEQNGWRLRIGSDDDADPNTPPPANYDNPDGRPGTGDEVQIGITQTTYQHNVAAVQCLTLYQFVRPDLPEVSFHNFDLDDNERVTYYPPSAIYDEQGALTPGSFAGTTSGNRVWNGGTQTDRGSGDVISQPESGWWEIVTCVREDNQFNQEGQTGVPIYRQPVPEPDMVIAKDDGRMAVAPGDLLAYTISFTNQSLTTRPTPGAALDVVITDTLPPNTTYRGCRLVSPGLLGRCEQRGGQVIFTLDEPVFAGDSGQVEVTVEVNSDARDQVVNVVELDYADLVGNQYPTERAEDIDLIPAGLTPDVVATKVARLKLDRNGNGKADATDIIEYTIGLENHGRAAALDLLVEDEPDQYTTLQVGSVRAEPGGTVIAGNSPGDRRVEARFDSLAAGATATVVFDVQVNLGIPRTVRVLRNQAIVSGSNVPRTPTDDPRTPPPGDPTDVPYDPPGNAIELLDLRAERDGDRIVLRWRTGTERDTAGFQLYRATRNERAAAVEVTPELIPARGGPAVGATYSWTDNAAPAGPVFYWLVEVEHDGDLAEYGPVSPAVPGPAQGNQIFLPLLAR